MKEDRNIFIWVSLLGILLLRMRLKNQRGEIPIR